MQTKQRSEQRLSNFDGLSDENNLSSTRYLSRSHSVPLPMTGSPVCQNCATSITPLWRRDESGATLCNACGLFLKLHGCARPTSLKTDIIKSRNRIKNTKTRSTESSETIGRLTRSGTASPPDDEPRYASSITPSGLGTLSSVVTGHTESFYNNGTSSRNTINNTGSTNNNTANTVNTTTTGVIGTTHVNNSNTLNTTGEATPTIDSLLQANAALRTRVSELELVNDLFRSRVSELEMNEAQMRRQDANLNHLDRQLRQREADLQRREAYLHILMRDMHHEVEQEEQQKRKKIRVSELLEETGSFLINTLPLESGTKKVKIEHPILSGV